MELLKVVIVISIIFGAFGVIPSQGGKSSGGKSSSGKSSTSKSASKESRDKKCGRNRIGRSCNDGRGICSHHPDKPTEVSCFARCNEYKVEVENAKLRNEVVNNLAGGVNLLECEDDYVAVGDLFFECNAEGNWETSSGKCVQIRINCGQTDDMGKQCRPWVYTVCKRGCDEYNIEVENAVLRNQVVHNQAGGVNLLKCEDNYVAVGGLFFACNAEGNWETSSGMCVRKCSPLSPTELNENEVIADGGNAFSQHGDVAVIDCQSEFALTGSIHYTCTNGAWVRSPTAGDCSPECSPLSPTELNENEVIADGGNAFSQHGDVAVIDCQSEFALTGSIHYTCTNGAWLRSPTAGECSSAPAPPVCQGQSLFTYVDVLPDANIWQISLADKQKLRYSEKISSQNDEVSIGMSLVRPMRIMNIGMTDTVKVDYVTVHMISSKGVDLEVKARSGFSSICKDVAVDNIFIDIRKEDAYGPMEFVLNVIACEATP